ncbi:MAG: hypothetical protein Q8913_15740, partial [Bacteroidota bacterium]|nr:hypothetical protein [Bacteroidota bacterium]
MLVVPEMQISGRAHVFRSTDNGATWLDINSLPFWVTGDVQGTSQDAFIQVSSASGTGGGIYRSRDLGATWEAIGGPRYYGPDNRMAVIQSCAGGITVFACDDSGGVWRTTLYDSEYSSQNKHFSADLIPSPAACAKSKFYVRVFSDSCPAALRIDSLVLDDSRRFSIATKHFPITLGGGVADSFLLQFSPLGQAGTFTAHLHIFGAKFLPDSTDVFDTILTLTAIAIPEPPSLLSSPTQFNFDSLSICVGLRDTSVMFINTGCTSDTLTDANTLGAGFSWLRDSLPIVIASGDSVRLRFRFVPPDSGAFTGTAKLTVVSMGLTQTPQLGFSGVGVHGTGILNVLSTSLQAGSFSFCAGDTTVFDTIKNTGCDTLSLSNGQLQGDPTFTLLTPLPTQLPPDSVAIISIHFSPRTKGPHTAQLLFDS